MLRKKIKMNEVAKNLIRLAKELVSYKDTDQIHDTGGKVERDESNRPGRDDLKKHHQDIRKMPKEQRKDFEDVNSDKDLRLN